MMLGIFSFGVFLILATTLPESFCKVDYTVSCNDNSMVVRLKKPTEDSTVYLEKLKYYPDVLCKPTLSDNGEVIFNFSFSDIFRCGLTRISSLNGVHRYYHRLVIENNNSESKRVIEVKCIQNKSADIDNNIVDNSKYNSIDYQENNGTEHDIIRRNILPASFYEEDVEITTTVEKNVPEPTLHVEVRQGSSVINGEVNVKPGTPLTMEISLDKESAAVYGILVSYMHVTDTKSQDEAIIFNGCSVNPSLFENFNTVDGDFLTARFRAFKFPDSTYVQFIGTVTVCLDKCKGVECSNGYTGYGRKKREVQNKLYDPKKVFEISLTAFIKVDYS